MASPEVIYETAKRLKADGRIDEALSLLTSVKDQTEALSPRANALHAELTALVARRSAGDLMAANSAEALKSMVTPETALGDVTVTTGKMEFLPEWRRDYYGDEYRYHAAERNKTYAVLSKVAVKTSATQKNPKMPQLALYRLEGDTLKHITTLSWAILQWDSYGSYLGNDQDFSNDFAYSDVVHFTLGSQIPDIELDHHLVALASERPCVERKENRFANPPVQYVPRGCSPPPQRLKASRLLDANVGWKVIDVAL